MKNQYDKAQSKKSQHTETKTAAYDVIHALIDGNEPLGLKK